MQKGPYFRIIHKILKKFDVLAGKFDDIFNVFLGRFSFALKFSVHFVILFFNFITFELFFFVCFLI